MKPDRRRRDLLLPGTALGVLVTYISSAMGLVPLGAGAELLPFLALGILGIVGVTELGRFLAAGRSSALTRAAVTFGTIGFTLWVVVVIVQNGSHQLWQRSVAPDLAAALPGAEQTAGLLFRGVSTIQATVDVGFDIFYCLSVILFGICMRTSRDFGRMLGWFGVVAAGMLLTLNLWTFPVPPAEAGLWDLGPVTGIWWVLVIVAWLRSPRRRDAVAAPA